LEEGMDVKPYHAYWDFALYSVHDLGSADMSKSATQLYGKEVLISEFSADTYSLVITVDGDGDTST
jgi:hypothetical protein